MRTLALRSDPIRTLLLGSVALGLLGLPLPLGAGEPPPNTVRGAVLRGLDETPVQDAEVSLAVSGQVKTARTDPAGQYSFTLSREEYEALPVDYYLSVKAAAPQAGAAGLRNETIVAQKPGKGDLAEEQLAPQAPVALEEASNDQRQVLPIFSGLIHLGDSDYAGLPNSQFQLPAASGGTATYSFNLPADFDTGKYGGASLELVARGLQCDDTVRVGDTESTIPNSPYSGAAATLAVSISLGQLVPGENSVAILSRTCPQKAGDLDDFEVTQVDLVLSAPVRFQVSGKVEFERALFRREDGLGLGSRPPSVLPARSVLVEVVDAGGGQVIGSGATDGEGAYTIPVRSFGGVSSFFVRATARLVQQGKMAGTDLRGGTLVEVRNKAGTLYSARSEPVQVASQTAITGVNLVARHASNRISGAFAILDTIREGFGLLVIMAEQNLTFPRLRVVWDPANGSDAYYQRCAGSYCEREIVLRGAEGVNTDEYDEPVIAHELGHYLQEVFARDDTQGGAHLLTDRQDPRKAFSEGWATAFALFTARSPIYYDTSGTGGRSLSFSIESYRAELDGGSSCSGLWNETSVAAFLWELGGKQAGTTFPWVFRALQQDLTGADAYTTLLSLLSRPMVSIMLDKEIVRASRAESVGPIPDAFGDLASAPSTADGGNCRERIYLSVEGAGYRDAAGLLDTAYGCPWPGSTACYCAVQYYRAEGLQGSYGVKVEPEAGCGIDVVVHSAAGGALKLIGAGRLAPGTPAQTSFQLDRPARVLITVSAWQVPDSRRCRYTLSLEER